MSALSWIATSSKRLITQRISRIFPKNKLNKNYIRRIETNSSGSQANPLPVNSQAQSAAKKIGRAVLLFGLVPGTLIAGALFAVPSTRDYVTSAFDMSWRFARSASTAALIAYDYKRSLRGTTEERRKIALQEAHERNAKRLLKLFKKQGGIYVKAGQHMSSLTYVLPPQYCFVMRELHNKAAYQDYEVIERAFEDEFGVKPDQAFDTFDRQPVAAASLAQVHHATKNGKEYAVKVQFPDIRNKAFADVNTIDSLVTVAAWFFPEFKLRWLVREFRDNLPRELDFKLEGRNAERARTNSSNLNAFTTPQVYWEMSTSRILTMEYIHGVHISDVRGLDKYGFNHKKVAGLFNKVLSEQIFLHGFVHCDPHPGNVLVRPSPKNRKEPQLVLLDNGLYKEYDRDFRLNYSNLWMSILQQDEESIKEYSLRLGPTSYQLFAAILTARSWNSVASSTIYKKLDAAEKQEIQSFALAHTSEITEILQTVPSALLLLLKTNDLMRVINHDLGMNSLNVFSTTVRYCLRSINEDRWRMHKGLRTWFRNAFTTLVLNVKLALLGWSMWLSSFMLTDE